MKNIMVLRLATAGLMLCALPALAEEPVGPEAKAALDEMSPQDREKTLAFEKSLHPTGGTVQVPGAHSSLNLGDQYYFLPAEEAKKLLVEAWGNPPDSVSDVLGMVFPKGRSFYDGTWGAVVTYDDTGHVEDKDAQSQDYDSVLENMKSGEADENAARKEAGYGAIHLVGWAQAPTYDSANKTLIWARNIKFDGAAENTLNYDVRKLARSGVVSMNMIDGMSHLALVRTAAGDLGRTVQLDSGSRYADFDSSTDKMADYGLAGLVAAGAGVAVAKKAGLLGIILLFLKKGIVIVLAAAAGAWAWFKRKFGFGKDEAGADEADYSAYSASSDALPEAPAEGDPGKTA